MKYDNDKNIHSEYDLAKAYSLAQTEGVSSIAVGIVENPMVVEVVRGLSAFKGKYSPKKNSVGIEIIEKDGYSIVSLINSKGLAMHEEVIKEFTQIFSFRKGSALCFVEQPILNVATTSGLDGVYLVNQKMDSKTLDSFRKVCLYKCSIDYSDKNSGASKAQAKQNRPQHAFQMLDNCKLIECSIVNSRPSDSLQRYALVRVVGCDLVNTDFVGIAVGLFDRNTLERCYFTRCYVFGAEDPNQPKLNFKFEQKFSKCKFGFDNLIAPTQNIFDLDDCETFHKPVLNEIGKIRPFAEVTSSFGFDGSHLPNQMVFRGSTMPMVSQDLSMSDHVYMYFALVGNRINPTLDTRSFIGVGITNTKMLVERKGGTDPVVLTLSGKTTIPDVDVRENDPELYTPSDPSIPFLEMKGIDVLAVPTGYDRDPVLEKGIGVFLEKVRGIHTIIDFKDSRTSVFYVYYPLMQAIIKTSGRKVVEKTLKKVCDEIERKPSIGEYLKNEPPEITRLRKMFELLSRGL